MSPASTPWQILNALWPFLQVAAPYARHLQSRLRAHPGKPGAENPFTAALTDADLSLQTLLEVAVLGTFPTLRFYGEEAAASYNTSYFRSQALGPPGDYLLLLDPIDGTRFYLDGQPNYHLIISLADAEDYAAVLLITPSQGTYIYALRGEGVYTGYLAQPLTAAVPYHLPTPQPVVYLGGTLGHLAAVLRPQFQVIHLPSDYSPAVPVPNHTGILDGSLTGSILVEAAWIDAAAVAFVAQEAGCVVTTLTGAALPPLHAEPAYRRAGVVIGTSPTVHRRLLEVLQVFPEGQAT
ncbi:MAG: inositol monophosphatase family protein [Candidatus Tectimicrobiota bacterium]